jgi:hypothetical protein
MERQTDAIVASFDSADPPSPFSRFSIFPPRIAPVRWPESPDIGKIEWIASNTLLSYLWEGQEQLGLSETAQPAIA